MNEKPYKRLYRSSTNKVISGVMGGIGEYFQIDPVIFRALYLVFTIFSGIAPGFFGYIVLALIIPKHHISEVEPNNVSSSETKV